MFQFKEIKTRNSTQTLSEKTQETINRLAKIN